MNRKPKPDHPLTRAQSSSTSGGPLVVSYRVERLAGGRIDVTLPHATTRRALAHRLREAADHLESWDGNP